MKKLLCSVLFAAMLLSSGAAFAQISAENGENINSEAQEGVENENNNENNNEEIKAPEVPALPVLSEKSFSAEMTLPISDFKAGDIVYINLDTLPEAGVYAFEAEFEYDNDLLEYKKTEVKNADEQLIKIEKPTDNGIFIALTQVGKNESSAAKDFAVLEFLTKKSGSCDVVLKSLKLVFSDMTYSLLEDINKYLNVTIKSEQIIIENKPNNSGGGVGGGSGGGGGSVGKPVTSVGAPKPEEPVIDPQKEVPNNLYGDVHNDFWAREAIEYLADKGILSGYEDGSFKPDNSISRGEFAKIMSCLPDVKYSPKLSTNFLDVEDDAWYSEAVYKVAELGIMSGDTEGYFMPDSPITREDAAAVIERGKMVWGKVLTPVREKAEFKDYAEISDYAKRSVEVLYMAGIVNGAADGSFNPKSEITRAEAAAMIYRFINSEGGEG